MQVYKTFKANEISNRIVSELNAAVLSATFPGNNETRKGIFKADLYHSVHSSDCLVFHGSCAPINDTFVKTIFIEF